MRFRSDPGEPLREVPARPRRIQAPANRGSPGSEEAAGEIMGIRFFCPNGHKLNVKAFQAGKRGICPHCGASMDIPRHSTRRSSRESKARRKAPETDPFDVVQLIQDEGVRSTQNEEHWAAVSAASPPRAPSQEFRPSSAPQSVVMETPRQPSEPPVPERERSNLEPSAAAPLDGSDPLADPSEVVWYVRPSAGGQFGPATREVMRKWISQGRVGPDALVWREGWRDWQEAANIFPQLSASDALPELENVIANEMALAWDDGRPISARHRDSAGSPLWVIGILLGIGLAILAAVFVWVRLS